MIFGQPGTSGRFPIAAFCVLLALLPGPLAPPAWAQEPAGISLWDQKESVNAVIFAPDGKTLITGGGNLETGHVALWDLDKMTRTALLTDTGMVNGLALSP